MAHQDWRENAQNGWVTHNPQPQYYQQPPTHPIQQGQVPPGNYPMQYPPPMAHGGAPMGGPGMYHGGSMAPPMGHPNAMTSVLPPPGTQGTQQMPIPPHPPQTATHMPHPHSHQPPQQHPSQMIPPTAHSRRSSRDPRSSAMRHHRGMTNNSNINNISKSSHHHHSHHHTKIDVKAKYSHQTNTVLHIAKDDYRDGFACLLSQIFGSPLIDVLKHCKNQTTKKHSSSSSSSTSNNNIGNNNEDYSFPLGSTAKDGLIFDGRIRLELILSYLPQAMTSSNKEVLVFELQPLAAVDSKSYEKFVQHYSGSNNERAGVVDHEFDMGIVCYFLPPKMVKMSVNINKKNDKKNRDKNSKNKDKNAQGSDNNNIHGNMMNIVKFFNLDDGTSHFLKDSTTGIGGTNKEINNKNVNLNVVWMIVIVSQNKLTKYLKENDNTKDVEMNDKNENNESTVKQQNLKSKLPQRKTKKKHKPKVKSPLLSSLIRLYTMADEPYTSSDEEMA